MPHLCFEVSWEVFDFPTCHCFLRGFALRTGQGQVCPSCRASPRGSRRGTPREPTGRETWGICVYVFFYIFVFSSFCIPNEPAGRVTWGRLGSPPRANGTQCECLLGSSGPKGSL